jgi:exodeoxyribonuclease VII large subunit
MDLFSFNYLEPESTPAPERKPKAKPAAAEEQLFTVTQLLRETRETLERGFSRIWVKGEISNFKPHPSGHQYFTLKDAGAQVSCVLWRSQAQTLSLKMRDGMEVQVCGDVTVYEARGQLQMTVRKVQQSGLGALQQRFEELKRQLAAEGLFASERKKSLPSFPETIAIITAASGAALRDMLHVLERRAPWVRVLVYSVAVQGQGAHGQIAEAIRWLSQPQPGLPAIDLLVVARGGGSLEDLWSFNEESVARALADCPLPTISAVGHEIDFTIADFVADLRAPTPSAAAEVLAPDRQELLERLRRWEVSVQARVRQALQQRSRMLGLMGHAALDRVVERAMANRQQSLDEARQLLEYAVQRQWQQRQTKLHQLEIALGRHTPALELQRRRSRLALLQERLQASVTHRFARIREQLEHQRRLLASLSPDATIARGYSLTTNATGKPLQSKQELKPGDTIRTKFKDGTVTSVVSTA